MDKQKKRSLLPAPVLAFIVAHLGVLAVTWAVATLVSRSHPELSPGGVHIRLVPVVASQ